MNEEMLIYWEHIYKMNVLFANSSEDTINILKKTLTLLKNTEDPTIKMMYGNPGHIQASIKEFENNCKINKSNIKEAEKQINFYKKLIYSKLHDTNKFQNN